MSSKNAVWQIHVEAVPDGVEVEFARDCCHHTYRKLTTRSTSRLEDLINHQDAELQIDLPWAGHFGIVITVDTVNLQGRYLSQEG